MGLGSLSEFEKTMKLSSPVVVAGDAFLLAPPPPPGLGPFGCPFLAIFGHETMRQSMVHVDGILLMILRLELISVWGV